MKQSLSEADCRVPFHSTRNDASSLGTTKTTETKKMNKTSLVAQPKTHNAQPTTLYPLCFHPILKERIWGGQKLQTVLNKDQNGFTRCGESWEISGLEDDVSVVSNGPLAGKDLNELLEIYGEELVGKKVYEQFGNHFPLLIKFLDAAEDLSVQVHPNDELASKRHNCSGKTEMWYIIEAEEDSKIVAGFKQNMTRESYLSGLQNKSLLHDLNTIEPNTGDVFYIPSGRVHSIGKGVLLAEIQQTSDITYRIYDFDRVDSNGQTRELHTELALDALDFSNKNGYKQKVGLEKNKSHKLLECPWFKTNLLKFDSALEQDLLQSDSFKIYMLVEGACQMMIENHTVELKLGDTILIPASAQKLEFEPLNGLTKVLEVYV